jgi:diguanylate cyclase (GGDEF)-like protein
MQLVWADYGQTVEMSPGQILWHAQDAGETVAVLLEGCLEVLWPGKHHVVLRRLHPGAILGEMSALNHTCHSATVRVDTPVRLVMIASPRFRELVREHSSLLAEILRQQAERIQSLSQDASDLFRDELTGVRNQRFFHKELLNELRRSRQGGQSVTLAVIDTDHFKSINDRFGHSAGDQVLASLGQLFLEELPPQAIPIRSGGDEFVVILPGCGGTEAVEIFARVQVRASQLRFEFAPHLTLRLSIGLATSPEEVDSVEELYDFADRAVYLAKAEGRNRVRRASQLQPGSRV